MRLDPKYETTNFFLDSYKALISFHAYRKAVTILFVLIYGKSNMSPHGRNSYLSGGFGSREQINEVLYPRYYILGLLKEIDFSLLSVSGNFIFEWRFEMCEFVWFLQAFWKALARKWRKKVYTGRTNSCRSVSFPSSEFADPSREYLGKGEITPCKKKACPHLLSIWRDTGFYLLFYQRSQRDSKDLVVGFISRDPVNAANPMLIPPHVWWKCKRHWTSLCFSLARQKFWNNNQDPCAYIKSVRATSDFM